MYIQLNYEMKYMDGALLKPLFLTHPQHTLGTITPPIERRFRNS